MPIIGFSFDKILVEKLNTAKGNIKINVRIDIKEITKEELKFGEKETIKISFVFSVEYEPKIASLSLEGNVFFTEESKKIKKILDGWKNKKLEEEIRASIFNFIITKCNVKALQLEEELGIPFHLPMPRVKES
ncbi:MAG: hypothetical protein NZ889_00120 [Candidatus Pacearchaeota archaeon]|nr:hypothetical protein [Candidatus Pacearchaeota archaeon]